MTPSSEQIKQVVGLIRGGMPVNKASRIVNQTPSKIRYVLYRDNIPPRKIKPSPPKKIKETNLKIFLQAAELLLLGATPDVLLRLTGVTIPRLMARFAELEQEYQEGFLFE